jgi:hypothetical protein
MSEIIYDSRGVFEAGKSIRDDHHIHTLNANHHMLNKCTYYVLTKSVNQLSPLEAVALS